MTENYFKQKELPYIFTLPYRDLRKGDYFHLSNNQLGSNGVKYVLDECKKHNKDMISVKENNGMSFWCIEDVDKEEEKVLAFLKKNGETTGTELCKRFHRSVYDGMLGAGLLDVRSVKGQGRGRPTIYYRINE